MQTALAVTRLATVWTRVGCSWGEDGLQVDASGQSQNWLEVLAAVPARMDETIGL